ncbi:MAG: CBS domain-containing protein [Pseudomonadales bacterium]
MQINEIMTKQVDYASPQATLLDLATRMREQDVGAIPIAENDRLIGMVTDRDIVVRGVAANTSLDGLTAKEVMTDNLLWCYDNQSVDEVLANMGEQKVRRLPVINKDKQLVGMISLGDLSLHGDATATGEALKGISTHAQSR